MVEVGAQASLLHCVLESLALALEIETRRVFLALVLAQDRRERLVAARSELASVADRVRGRVAAGAQSDYDAARLEVELARIDAEIATTEADVTSASRALAQLAARADWSPRARATIASLASEPIASSSIDDVPAVRVARLEVVGGERDVRRAELDRIPEIRLGVGAYLTTDGDSGSAYVGLSAPLPLFDTGEAEVRRARAAHTAAQARLASVEAIVHGRLASAEASLSARRDALRALDDRVSVRLPALRSMAEAAYALGSSGIFELLDAFRAELEIGLARIDLAARVVEAQIDVRAAMAPP